jgi:hypothetical protein
MSELMTSALHRLRFIQAGCMVLILACILVGHFLARSNGRPATVFLQLIIVLAAVWSGTGGFTFQRKLLKARPSVEGSKSTPFMRWKASQVFRLWSAVSVVVWGLVLREVGGSLVLADVLFGLGTVLLLTWKPATFSE